MKLFFLKKSVHLFGGFQEKTIFANETNLCTIFLTLVDVFVVL